MIHVRGSCCISFNRLCYYLSGDGEINFGEYLDMMCKKMSYTGSVDQIREAFKVNDLHEARLLT